MTDIRRWRFFDDQGKRLDRFGPLLLLTAVAVATLSLFNLETDGSDVGRDLGWFVVSVALGGALLLALQASGVARRWRRIAAVIVGLMLTSSFVFTLLSSVIDVSPVFHPGRPSPFWVVITVIAPVVVLRRVLSQPTVTINTLFGALSVYLLMAITFNYIFLEVSRYSSVPFFGVAESTTSFMYFSLVSITTVGYGDLAAVTNLGRLLATTEAVIGQVFLVTIVARLVGILSQQPRDIDA